MAIPSKHFGASATASRSNIFQFARVKLTIFYVVITIIILAIFSFALYARVAVQLRQEYAGRRVITETGSEENVAENALERIEVSIAIIDGAVLVVAGAFSFMLAGYTLKPIRKALEAQSNFSAEASHELRTPLAVMRTSIEVLLRGKQPLSDEVRAVLKKNLDEIHAMTGMTERLLQLSRGQRVGLEKMSRVNFSELAGQVTDQLRVLATKKEIAIETKIDPAVFVQGYAADLERMLKNILINAITYTPAHGKILVSVNLCAKFAEISITDNGIGIDASDLAHIFEPFYKANRSREIVDNQSGSGLGLALVKQIVEQHEGTIEIKSAVQQGTAVLIQIPAVN